MLPGRMKRCTNPFWAVINSVELYLNHGSLGQQMGAMRFSDYFCNYQSKKKIASGSTWDYALLLTGNLILKESISTGLLCPGQHGQGQLGDGLPQWDVQQHR